MLLGSVIFLSAFLLFQMQLIVAKHLLPWLGNTGGLDHQSDVFPGPAARGLRLRAPARQGLARVTQPRIHVALLLASSVAVLALLVWGGAPLLAPDSMKPTEANNPVWLLLTILAATVAVPFFALSTTARCSNGGTAINRRRSRKPIACTGCRTPGSLLGLASYPLGFERWLDLPSQAWLWAGGFALFITGGVLICRKMSALGDAQPKEKAADSATPGAGDARPSWSRMTLWLPERCGLGHVPGDHEPALARRRRHTTAVGVAPGDLSRRPSSSVSTGRSGIRAAGPSRRRR